MDGNLSFNIEKLNEVYDEITNDYREYKELIVTLDQAITKLEATCGASNTSLYQILKEKYLEKKQKLQDAETMMKELIDTLERKRIEIEAAVEITSSAFE